MEDLAVKVGRSEIERLYDTIDNARRKQGLPVPEYRSIREFEPTKRSYRISCNGISLFMVSEPVPSDDELYDYMRYATVVGDGRTVYAVYYKRNRAVRASYAGKLGLHRRCVVREVESNVY